MITGLCVRYTEIVAEHQNCIVHFAKLEKEVI